MTKVDAEPAKATVCRFRVRSPGLFVAALVVGDPLRHRLEEWGASRARQGQGLKAGGSGAAHLFDGEVFGAGRFFLAASAARGRRTDD